MVAWDGGVSGTWEYARVKTTPSCARRSRFGVSRRLEPRKSMRSARVVSSVMMITLWDGAFGVTRADRILGLDLGAGLERGAGFVWPVAIANCVRKRKTNARCGTCIG